MTEEWRDIYGYEGCYQISNVGRVKNLKRAVQNRSCMAIKRERIMKLSVDKDGYYKVCLCKNNIKQTRFVHRLVATAFIQNPNQYPVINHKDENKKNNNPNNLEWCDVKYNTNYKNMPHRRANNLRKAVIQYTKDMQLVNTWTCRSEIEKVLNVSGGDITMCCLGRRKTAYGFIWKYAN